MGDSANHNGFRRRLIEVLGNIDFEEIEIREFYQSWNLRDFNSDEFVELCNKKELVIFGGGGFFEPIWDYSCTGTTLNISNETLDKIKTPILFHGVGCDITKGVTEKTIKKFRLFLDRLVNDKNIFVSVRNEGSFEAIETLFGNRFEQKICCVPDGAFFLETQKFEFPEVRKNYRLIGINIQENLKNIQFSLENSSVTYEGFLEELAKSIMDFLDNYTDYQIIFFPHIYSDLLAIYELMNLIGDQYRRTRMIVAPLLTGLSSGSYFFGLYKECDIIIGMRFHTNVCAIAQNISSIAMTTKGYRRITDLHREVNLMDRLVDVSEMGFGGILNKMIDETLVERVVIEKAYQEVNVRMYEDSLAFYNGVKTWFGQVS